MSARSPEKIVARAKFRAKVAQATYRGERSRYNRGAVRVMKRELSRARRRADKIVMAESGGGLSAETRL